MPQRTFLKRSIHHACVGSVACLLLGVPAVAIAQPADLPADLPAARLDGDAVLPSTAIETGRLDINAAATELAAASVAQQPALAAPAEAGRIEWSGLLRDSVRMLLTQHAGRLVLEEPTRDKLRHGPFFEDYFHALKTWKGWGDNNKFFTNYVAHPAMGSASAFVFAHRDPVSRRAKFWTREYATAKTRQLAYSTLYSMQFEFGLLSEASIGNVDQTGIDLVLTPALGLGLSIAEEAIDHHVIRRMRVNNPKMAKVFTVILNPSHTFANLMGLRAPWARY